MVRPSADAQAPARRLLIASIDCRPRIEYSEIEESDYGETSSLPTLGSTISE
jgi:hypothetical protein